MELVLGIAIIFVIIAYGFGYQRGYSAGIDAGAFTAASLLYDSGYLSKADLEDFSREAKKKIDNTDQ